MQLQSVPYTKGSSLVSKLALLFILIIWGAGAIGQVTFFSENVGTPSGTTAISSYTGWQNGSPVLFSGTADVRSTSPSNTYTGFSAAGNVFFTTTIGTNLVISGINSSIYTSITMSLGHYKSTTAASNELIIEVSSDGVTYLPLTYSRPSGTGTTSWLLVNPTGNIPSTPNLRIRFRQTSTASQFRIDDIKLAGIVNCPVQVTSFAPSSGPAGTEVTILGSGFFGTTGVFFNGIAASSFTVNSDINIKAIVPVGANSGNISIVNNCTGGSVSAFTIINTTCAFNGSNLILSELCIPNINNGTDRYIEIFNPTNASVDLTGWIVNAISNGDISSSCLSWVLFGNILPGQAKTCGYTNPVNGGPHDFPHPAWWASYPTNTNPNDCNYNWNGQQHDGASLYNGSTRIDGIFRSVLDNDWYNHKSLIRNPDICSPNSNSSYTEWSPSAIVPAAGTAPSTPRAHTANCVILQPAITQHPQSQTYCENQSGSLSVAASGGLQPYNYIWKVYTGSGTWQTVVNSSVYGGANTSTLTFSSLPLSFDGYQYYCEIYNQDNSCYKASNAAVIHVSGSPILIVTNPPVACSPNTVNLTLPAVTAGSTLGSATLSYWQNSSCTVSIPTPSAVSVSGTYYIKASTGTGCENIQPVTVSIGSSPAPVLSVSSNPPTLCADDPGNIVLTAVGGSGTSIEWFDDVCGGNLIGTVNSLTIPSPALTTTYFARWVSPGCGPSICKSVQVNVNNPPNITSATPLPASCGSDNGSITIVASGGTPPYWYSIDNGTNWGTEAGFTLLPAGTYLVKVKDANCESLAVSVVVGLSGSSLTATVSHQDVKCFGDNNGTATVSANGGSGTLTYTWNTIPQQFGVMASNLSPGTYICTISDGSCSIDVTVEITQPLAALSGGILTHTDIDCTGNNNGSAEVSAGGGTEPYTYLWNTVPAQNGAIASNLLAGNYSCTVTDINSCFITIPVSILQPSSALSASIPNPNGVSCFGNSDGSATVNVSGGMVSYQYEWNTIPIQNTATASNLPPGSYTCIVTDAHGCTTTATANITQPLLLTGSISAQTSFICEGATNGTATVLPNGGTPNYTFLWNTSPAQSTSTASNLPVGTFNCTIKDIKGCEAYVSVSIDAFASPTAADAGSPQTVCGSNTTLNGNQPAIGTGIWTKISGPNTLTIVSPASYNTAISTTAPGIFNLTWTITNEPSCPSSSDTVSVEFGNAVTVLAGSNSPVCSNDDIVLTSSIASAIYSWSGPVGFSSTEQNPVRNNANTTYSGDYIVNVSGISGNCPNTSDTIQVNVVNSPSPPVTVNSNLTLVCANDAGNIVLTANGGSGTTVEWFEDFCSGTPIGTGISLTIPSPNVTTTYFARWTSGTCGNSACQSVLVDVSEPPTASNAGNPQTVCGFSTSLHGNKPLIGNGLWSKLSGPPTLTIVSPTDTNSLVTSTGPGIFQLVWTITSSAECAASSDTVSIEFGDAITVLASSNSPVCTPNDIQLSSSITGAAYAWRGPAGFLSSAQNPVRTNSTILYSGDYIVDVSGIPGNCPQTSDTVHVIVAESPSAPIGVNSNLSVVCANDGGNIILTANGGSGTALEWYEGSLSNPSIGSGPSISISSPDTTTTYFAVWTSANCGNSGSKSVTVVVADPPTVADAGNAKTVCGFLTTLNGNIPLVGTGKWSQVSGPPTLTIVSPTNAKSGVTSTGPGIFNLVWAISNSTDCPESSDTLKLEFGNTISVVASSNSPVCSGDTIKLFSSITGATYSWKGPNNFLSQIQNPVISNVVHSDSGQYIVYVSGISGNCPNTTDTIYVKFNSPPSIISSADSICSGQTVVLTAIGCKGVVNWSDGSKGATLTKILSSNSVFTATCTDNSCETEPGTPVSIAVVPADFESISGNSSFCEKGTIQLNANGIATTYKWTLPDGSTTGNQNFQKDTVSINDSGIYSLLSTSSKGCTDYDSLEIKVNPLPVINISVKDTACVGSTEEFLAGEGYASYLWQNNSKLSTCPALAEGIYWVLVTDSSGCKSSDTAWLENCYANIFIPNAFSPNGDLKNDHFKPVTGGLVLLDYSMIIFNRWGQIIFQSEDYLTGWDGKMNGAELPVGTYAYLISYRISDTANQTLSELMKNRGTVLIVK